jgi:hypothetical protein
VSRCATPFPSAASVLQMGRFEAAYLVAFGESPLTTRQRAPGARFISARKFESAYMRAPLGYSYWKAIHVIHGTWFLPFRLTRKAAKLTHCRSPPPCENDLFFQKCRRAGAAQSPQFG